MSENTKIEWCDHTFNPWVGCVKVSLACDHCYAESWAKRSGQVVWGGDRKRTSIANWRLPIKWNEQAAVRQHGWEICVSMHPDGEAAAIAAGFIKPVRPKVFCASLADVFDNKVPTQWRMDLFSLIADTPHLDWLILTKRIGNVMPMCSGDSLMFDMISQRVWLGATICNQEEADRDIKKLLATPAAKRFLSMEPLLGPVDLTDVPMPGSGHGHHEFSPIITGNALKRPFDYPPLPSIDWVIVGGESGPNARPMHPDWARSLRDQCTAAGVHFLFKQWGEFSLDYDRDRDDPDYRRCDAMARKKGRWINIAGGHGFNGQRVHFAEKVGKNVAGRLLDGRTWDEAPT